MHVLVIPSERYLPADDPMAGIFQHDLVHLLAGQGVRTGVLSVELRPARLLTSGMLGWKSGQEVGHDGDVVVYRHHGWFFPPLWRRGYLLQALREGRRLFARYMREQGRPDIIHAHNGMRAGILARDIARTHGIPYLLTEHSSQLVTGGVSAAERAALAGAYRDASRRIVVSPPLGQALELMFGADFQGWHCLPNMVGPGFAAPVPASGTRERTIFVTVGGLIELKRHEALVRAFARRFHGDARFGLVIVGDGPLRGRIEGAAANLGVAGQVAIIGRLSRSGVCGQLAAADIYVHASSYETFGVAIIEALASGLPVISTRCGGPDDIVTPENGLLVPVDDEEAMGEAMQTLAATQASYDRQAISRSCQALYGPQAVGAKLMEMYHAVLVDSGGPGERVS